MKFGYARVSTLDQNADLQVDQLQQAGCEQILRETASGAKAARPVLDSLLNKIRPGDVIVVWKLDRLGRSLRHLIELVNQLMDKEVGLKSLQDPVDTTSAQGRLVFNIFASLAEFERDLIIERTQAGLAAARARGRLGGRPKGLTEAAEKKAIAAEALYTKGELSVNEVADNLGISKATLYRYLRYRGVRIGNKPGIIE
jgi:DNA invertase Pin-like site-specific DNA recombinase